MPDLPPIEPIVEIALASTGMSKGISQTDGLQVVPKVALEIGPVQVGAQWKNLTSPTAEGEAQAFISASRNFGPVELSAGLAYKLQTDAIAGTDNDAVELSFGATRKFGQWSARLNTVYSPDDVGGTRRSLYTEAGLSVDAIKSIRLSATVGRRERQGSPDYTAFSAGATKTLPPGLTLDLRYHDTAQSHLGVPYRRRIVVAGRWRL